MTTPRLFCHHGHLLEATRVASGERCVCPVCGSVTRVVVGGETRGEGSFEATIASESAAPISQEAEALLQQGGLDSARLATEAYASDARLASATPASGTSDRSTEHVEVEPPELDGFELGKELGRGGMGVVYRARDEKAGREVALKTLQRMSPDGLQRFKQEFRAIADIAHPNLASLYELLSDGETWCFTMEVLEGVDFLEYVWSGFDRLGRAADEPLPLSADTNGIRLTPERVERLRDGLTQLVLGLNALHDAGMLHSDIKPSNVMMTRQGRLVLLDFGLVSETQPLQVAGSRRLIQGTPDYMSPEQAEGGPLTPASDWYAVGVMIYELLAGRLPYEGKTMDVMRRKQTDNPRDLDTVDSEAPPALTALCQALLQRDPTRRPAPADVLAAIGADDAADELAATSQRTVTRAIDLVGRERQLELLNQRFNEVRAGNTLSVFVHGNSGMGKSVLVRSFLDSVKEGRIAVVLEGRCYEQESVPFKALDSLIDSLTDYVEMLPVEFVQGVMPRDRLALTKVFPVLGRAPEVPNATYPTVDNADQQELRQRAMNALRELLQRLAIREPLVLYVDDLQWGDADSAGLLADLVRPPDAPRMLLLGSYRTEDADSSACLQAITEAYSKGEHLPHREELLVKALTDQEAADLALALLGRDDDANRAFAEKIAKESGGWPFFVWELAQHVQDDPQIADQSLDLDEVIWTRVSRLTPETRQLLELFAVAGRPLPASDAYAALDVVDRGPGLLAHLRACNFIRTTESDQGGTLVETYHDRIRESVVTHLSAEALQEHNRRLAVTLEDTSDVSLADVQRHIEETAAFEEPSESYSIEKQQWQRLFDLAYFFDAAGLAERALPYALVAAEQARRQNALDVSQQQYHIAGRGAVNQEAATRFRVSEGLGDVLVLRGMYDQADEHFRAAAELATDDITRARLDGKRGYQFFKKGEMGSAAKFTEQALSQLGNPPPGNGVLLACSLAKEGAAQMLHTYMPSRFVGQRDAESEAGAMDFRRIHLYDGLGYPYWFSQGPIPTLWTHLRHMNLAERYPPSQLLGRAYAMHAIMMTAIPLAQRGANYADKAYHIHGELGDRLGQGKARSFQTFSLLALGKFREGVETGREAVELLDQAGDVWERNMARIILSQPLYFLGQLEDSYSTARRAYESCVETGDTSGAAIALYFWVPSHPASLPDGALQMECEQRREDPLSSSAGIQGRGLELLLRDDDPIAAADVLQESLDVAKQRGLRNPCIFGGVTWKATALRVAAEREDGAAKPRALSAAKKQVNAALRITKSYLSLRARALRERAIIATLEQQPEVARRFFTQSLDVADAQNAAYEQATTLLAQGEAGQQFGWPDADRQVAEARQRISEIEAFRTSE